MITTVSLDEVAVRKTRAVSQVNEYILRELEALKDHLAKKRKERKFGPMKIDFDDIPDGKPNRKNALNKFREMARNYIASQGLELRIVGGQEGGNRSRKAVLFIIPGKEPAPKRIGRRNKKAA